jgi:hypothetical protein
MSDESEDTLIEAEDLRQELFMTVSDYSMKSTEIALAAVLTEIILINHWDVEDVRDYFRIIWKNAEKINSYEDKQID